MKSYISFLFILFTSFHFGVSQEFEFTLEYSNTIHPEWEINRISEDQSTGELFFIANNFSQVFRRDINGNEEELTSLLRVHTNNSFTDIYSHENQLYVGTDGDYVLILNLDDFSITFVNEDNGLLSGNILSLHYHTLIQTDEAGYVKNSGNDNYHRWENRTMIGAYYGPYYNSLNYAYRLNPYEDYNSFYRIARPSGTQGYGVVEHETFDDMYTTGVAVTNFRYYFGWLPSVDRMIVGNAYGAVMFHDQSNFDFQVPILDGHNIRKVVNVCDQIIIGSSDSLYLTVPIVYEVKSKATENISLYTNDIEGFDSIINVASNTGIHQFFLKRIDSDFLQILGNGCIDVGGSIHVNRGHNYTWFKDGEIIPDYNRNYLSNVEEGVYKVVAVSCLGDSDSAEISIPTVNPNLGEDKNICNDPVLLESTYYEDAQYLWSTGETTSTIEVNNPGEYWVEIDLNGCIRSDTIEVLSPDGYNINLEESIIECEEDNLTLEVPNHSDLTYLWSNGSSSNSISVNSEGEYWVRVTTSEGCIISDTTTVSFSKVPFFDLGNDRDICFEEEIEIGIDPVNGLLYEWSTGENNSKIDISSGGIYWLDISDENGCIRRDSIIINQIENLAFDLGENRVICRGDSILLSAPLIENANYLWSTGDTENEIYVSSEGLYSLQIIKNNCSYQDEIEISTESLPEIVWEELYEVCDSVSISVPQGDYTVEWSNGSTSNSILVNEEGMYTVAISNSVCQEMYSTEVVIIPEFIIEPYEVVDMCLLDSLTLQIPLSDYENILWSDGSTNETISITSPGLYKAIITNECSQVTKTFEVLKENCICSPFIPGAFAPNGNGKNEIFIPIIECDLELFSMKIYNRWGDLVFGSNSIEEGWDGDNNQQGSYIYLINYKTTEGEEFRTSGLIQLIR